MVSRSYLCECSDSGCPVKACHGGKCSNRELATIIVFRVDMGDVTGTAMCRHCADDAMDSGLFREVVIADVNHTCSGKPIIEIVDDDCGDSCPHCGEPMPDVNASPVICSYCGEEVE